MKSIQSIFVQSLSCQSNIIQLKKIHWCETWRAIQKDKYLFHCDGAGCCSVMAPPPGVKRHRCWLKLKWEWHWDWVLWWGKCVSEGSVWSERWVHSSPRLGHCRCFRHSPACATCDETAHHVTVVYGATRGKKFERENVGNLLYSFPLTCAQTHLPHACKVRGCSSQWRHTLIGSN